MKKEKFASPKFGSNAINPASHARRHSFTHPGQNLDKCPSSPRSPILNIDNDQWRQDCNRYIFECIDFIGTEEVSNCSNLVSIRNGATSTRKNRYGVAPQQKEYKDLIRKYPHCKQQSIKRSKSNPILEKEKEAFKANDKKTNDKCKRVRFPKNVVTEIRYRPEVEKKDWNKLYYSSHELQRMIDSNSKQKKQIIVAEEIDLEFLELSEL
ncbi:predicted protein [Chaetoceros tenuissimus]|uniref:Uncharacterized protein n=1 Tax=Chaetoceros tenuissimus TaxID=426638 RepID=A0AAD3D7M4_9STRA|nr:predicted protein [Chaetoceros tenuissimus]